MTADWTTCRVVRQEDAGLFFRTEDAPVNAGGPTWRAQNGEPWTTRDLCELLPLVPVLDADGVPVVTTVGDLTARHIGRRARRRCGMTGRSLPARAKPRPRGVPMTAPDWCESHEHALAAYAADTLRTTHTRDQEAGIEP